MASNETIADIVVALRAVAYIQTAESPRAVLEFANRIEAAHNREIAAKDDERLTIVANYEHVIAAKDAKIAELRERLKVAEDALTELQTRLVASVHDGTMNPYEALDITERALAAIREKGGAK